MNNKQQQAFVALFSYTEKATLEGIKTLQESSKMEVNSGIKDLLEKRADELSSQLQMLKTYIESL